MADPLPATPHGSTSPPRPAPPHGPPSGHPTAHPPPHPEGSPRIAATGAPA